MKEKEIGCVSRGDEIGVNSSCATRQVKYLLTITYDDATETCVDAEGKCIAYLQNGFLVKSNGRYQFYDVAGKIIADKDMSQYGDCVEIAALNNLYIFDTFGDGERDATKFIYGQNRFAIDFAGNVAQAPDPMIGWPVEQLYSYWDDEEDDDESAEDVAADLEYSIEGTPLNLELLRNMLSGMNGER